MAKDKYDDIFGEMEEQQLSKEEYDRFLIGKLDRKKYNAKRDALNNVPPAPPLSPEIIARRELYKKDFITMHREVYAESTGIRPFGEEQKKSIQFGRDVFEHGGRLLKLEPRGYAKTTRLSNEALIALLLGMQEYIVIICSNQEKAEEILESIKSEAMNNEVLMELFPGPISCVRAVMDNFTKGRWQTYDGEPTFLRWQQKSLRFPYIEGEPSSGRYIEIRPMSNLKGLHKKLTAGKEAGKILRPTLYLFDDPQTHDDAISATNVKAIINRIKRDALRGGSHIKRASAIMAITPVCAGDVAHYFENFEHSWDIIRYKMVEKFPDRDDWWMDVYAKSYHDYNRTERGARTRAHLKAMKLVQDNYDMVHKGSIVTWDHAYCWDEDPIVECSALQHAYNIILDDGMENFMFECQCVTDYGADLEGERLNASTQQILSKATMQRRNYLPQKNASTVAHIDVGKHFLSYAIVCSPNPMQPHVVDYGVFPKQPTAVFTKNNIMIKMAQLFPQCTDYRDVIYLGVKTLIETLATRTFTREDGAEVTIDAIGVDVKYESTYVSKAIRESPFRNIVYPTVGLFVGPDDKTLTEAPPAKAVRTYDNCYIAPNKTHTLDYLYIDTNFFKTEVHRAWNLPTGIRNSLSIYGRENEGEVINQDIHLNFAEHFNTEIPTREMAKKSENTRITWKGKYASIDNEFFDNVVACFALLYTQNLSVQLDVATLNSITNMDMSSFISRQAK